MDVHVTHEVKQFLAEAGTYLASRPVEHNLVLSLAHLSIDEPSPCRGTWVTNGTEVVGTLIQTPSTHIASVTPMPGPAIEALVEHLSGIAPDMPGMNGEARTVATFAGAWATACQTPAQPVAGQRLYRLGDLQLPRGVAGRLRLANDSDLNTLVAWDEAFTANTRMNRPPQSNRTAFIAKRVSNEMFWVWEVANQPVSMAFATPPLAGASRIGAVYTPPDHRRNGYASAAVGAISHQLRQTGVDDCLLYTQLTNPTSNRIYQRLGYQPVAEILAYRFGDSSTE